MKAAWFWFVGNALWTVAGSAFAASLVAVAFRALVSAPVGAVVALWVATSIALAAIVALIGRLWWPSAPLLVWSVEISPNDYLWDDDRKSLLIRVTLTAVPAAGSAVVGKTKVSGEGRVVGTPVRSRIGPEHPLSLAVEFGPMEPPTARQLHTLVTQRYRRMGSLTWHTSVLLLEVAEIWGATGAIPALHVLDDDSRPRKTMIEALLQQSWSDLERWHRQSWGRGFANEPAEAVPTSMEDPARSDIPRTTPTV